MRLPEKLISKTLQGFFELIFIEYYFMNSKKPL